jgi:hypothetical protein
VPPDLLGFEGIRVAFDRCVQARDAASQLVVVGGVSATASKPPIAFKLRREKQRCPNPNSHAQQQAADMDANR